MRRWVFGLSAGSESGARARWGCWLPGEAGDGRWSARVGCADMCELAGATIL